MVGSYRIFENIPLPIGGAGPVNLGLRLYQDFGVENGPQVQDTLVYLEIGLGWPYQANN